MRKLSITLLLIVLSFMTMEANCLSSHRGKYIQLKIWDHLKKDIVFIPIEAVLEGNNIEVQFFGKSNEPTTFQVKDKNGNIVFQAGQYELLYIEKDVTFIGEFEIE